MNGTTTALEALQPLTEADRLDARDQAKRNVIRRAGERPRRADFRDHAIGDYSPGAVRLITGFMVVLITAMFVISSMRLFHIGRATFGETIAHERSATAAGVAIIFGAEAGTLGFMLFAGLLGRDNRRDRRALYFAAGLSTAIALVGNVQQALGASWRGAITADPFGFLEATAPPVIVLFGATVLKHFLLDGMKQRRANEAAYQAALADWEKRTADPEGDPQWPAAYATALREKLMQVNAKGRGRDDRLAIMQGLAPSEWRDLVMREIQADQWWHEPAAISQSSAAHAPAGVVISPLSAAPVAALTPSSNGNGHGHHNGNGRG